MVGREDERQSPEPSRGAEEQEPRASDLRGAVSRDLTGRNWSFERKARERMRKGYWGTLAGSPHPAGSNTVARGSRVPHTPGEVQRKRKSHLTHKTAANQT